MASVTGTFYFQFLDQSTPAAGLTGLTPTYSVRPVNRGTGALGSAVTGTCAEIEKGGYVCILTGLDTRTYDYYATATTASASAAQADVAAVATDFSPAAVVALPDAAPSQPGGLPVLDGAGLLYARLYDTTIGIGGVVATQADLANLDAPVSEVPAGVWSYGGTPSVKPHVYLDGSDVTGHLPADVELWAGGGVTSDGNNLPNVNAAAVGGGTTAAVALAANAANLDAAVSSAPGAAMDARGLTLAWSGQLDDAVSSRMASGPVVLAGSQPNYAPAKAGDAMTLTTGERTAVGGAVWTSGTRTLTALAAGIVSGNLSANVVQWGGGGLPTGFLVTGYASGQSPAALVLDAAASDHNTAGTIGAKVNAAGGAADPLANPVPGTYGTGSAGAALGRLANPINVIIRAETVQQT